MCAGLGVELPKPPPPPPREPPYQRQLRMVRAVSHAVGTAAP